MTETAPERLGAIRTALAELVDEHGDELLSNPARMSNLIKDLLPDDQQLARILVIAAEQDVASKLREHVSQGMDAGTATRLVATSFAASTMFAQQACLWVVGELAVAMGLASGETTSPAASEPGPTPERPSLSRQDLQSDPAPPPHSEPTPRLTHHLDDRSRPVRPGPVGPAEFPSPRPRRGLYLAIAAAAVVVVVAAAVILGMNIGSTPGATPPPAGHSPSTASSPSPATAHAPARGNFTIGRQISNDGALVLTLTTIKLSNDRMTVNVTYHNATSLPQILSCLGDSDPSASSVTLANGTAINSAATYCSDHPSAAFTLNAGATHTSYAVFHVPAGFPEPFAFTWSTGTGSSTVSNLKL
jgi:uncharacterized protein YoaH (UPF0181 family)